MKPPRGKALVEIIEEKPQEGKLIIPELDYKKLRILKLGTPLSEKVEWSVKEGDVVYVKKGMYEVVWLDKRYILLSESYIELIED